MKKLLLFLLIAIATSAMNAQIIVSGEITSNTTWSNDNIYLLDGWVYVRNGATLTIEPGTLIKGDFTTKGALIVERGGKLMAEGTETEPIVFTSQKPAGQRSYGDWGGVILCGRATINAPENAGAGTAAGEAIIEGGVGSIYGGGASPDDDDNSGTLRYVRIEFGGIPFQPNSEINGLTLGGVGRGTIIDHVQVSYSGDDAIEWFGGTVNCSNLVTFKNWDDDFDTDFGYRGNVQFGLVIRDPNIADQSGSNGLESDNDGQGTGNTPITRPVFSNITVVGPLTFNSTINSNYKRALHLRRNTQTSVFNSVFIGYPVGLLIDGSTTQLNAQNNDMRFKNSVVCFMNDSLATSTNANPNNVSGTFNIDSWFNTAGYGNSLVNDASMLQFSNVSNTTPNFTLLPGSSLHSGASFEDSYLNNSFFSTTSYRGAFGGDNWATCWTEFDPINANYDTAINNSITANITASGNTTVCVGESVTLNATTNSSSASIVWSNGSNGTSTTVQAPASVTMMATNSKGCVSETASIELNTFAIPEVSITANGPTSFCTGGTVVLSSSQNSGNTWSNDAASQTITVSASGTYSLMYVDANGCEAQSNSIEVNVSDSPAPTISTSGAIAFCEGESVVLTASESDSYQWSLNGQIIADATSQTMTAELEGGYSVTVTNANQCDGVGTSSFVFVQVNQSPTATFNFDTAFGTGTYEFNNNSTNASTYHWDFGDGSTSTDVNPTHTFTTAGEHTITLVATNGDCESEFTYTITDVNVENIRIYESISLYPNPTEENSNLVLQLNNTSDVSINIFDITGKVVYAHTQKNATGNYVAEIPSAQFEAGVYLVQVNAANNSNILRLVVKN